MEEEIQCAGFEFFSNFDSANLSRIEYVAASKETAAVTAQGRGCEAPDVEFNVWSKPDCHGTEFVNGNRTWFYFGIRSNTALLLVKLNIVDLNRQVKMYSQGMSPVYRVVPGRPNWDRIRDKPIFCMDEAVFTLSFKYRTPENVQSITYFAFTYPYSYTELQNHLVDIDKHYLIPSVACKDDIYYHRECLCYSLEGRRVDLVTISSHHNISSERELKLKNVFPEPSNPRPFRFVGKKVVFVSARVHPGETPSSFVFNGLLALLLNREDPVAVALRKLYVFKLLPFLNPDGVVKGHYRTDTRGINLNRMYLNPSLMYHPSVYAARALIRYYHYGFQKEDNFDTGDNTSDIDRLEGSDCEHGDCNANESGLYLYLDLHGHASKKGIFMYGNHFEDLERNVECMLLPKIMSINNHNFHFTACNFTERNMYLRDRRDGMSKEGSGRVAVLKLTGLVRSYTLECNYNTGRLVNVLPPTIKESSSRGSHAIHVPPKYNPQVYEDVGKALGASILDLTGHNPATRLPNSQFHSLGGVREWLRVHCANEMGDTTHLPQPPARIKLRNAPSTHAQVKSRSTAVKTTSIIKTGKRIRAKAVRSVERKENIYDSGNATDNALSQPSCSSATFLVPAKLQADNNTEEKATTIAATKKSQRAQNLERIKLREICFVKGVDGKRVIAKYKTEDNSDEGMDDSLIVSWDKSNNAQVFAHKGKTPAVTAQEASRKGTFRIHNFAKTTIASRNKKIKRPLRRITTDISIKVDKLKKRKILKGAPP